MNSISGETSGEGRLIEDQCLDKNKSKYIDNKKNESVNNNKKNDSINNAINKLEIEKRAKENNWLCVYNKNHIQFKKENVLLNILEGGTVVLIETEDDKGIHHKMCKSNLSEDELLNLFSTSVEQFTRELFDSFGTYHFGISVKEKVKLFSRKSGSVLRVPSRVENSKGTALKHLVEEGKRETSPLKNLVKHRKSELLCAFLGNPPTQISKIRKDGTMKKEQVKEHTEIKKEPEIMIIKKEIKIEQEKEIEEKTESVIVTINNAENESECNDNKDELSSTNEVTEVQNENDKELKLTVEEINVEIELNNAIPITKEKINMENNNETLMDTENSQEEETKLVIENIVIEDTKEKEVNTNEELNTEKKNETELIIEKMNIESINENKILETKKTIMEKDNKTILIKDIELENLEDTSIINEEIMKNEKGKEINECNEKNTAEEVEVEETDDLILSSQSNYVSTTESDDSQATDCSSELDYASSNEVSYCIRTNIENENEQIYLDDFENTYTMQRFKQEKYYMYNNSMDIKQYENNKKGMNYYNTEKKSIVINAKRETNEYKNHFKDSFINNDLSQSNNQYINKYKGNNQEMDLNTIYKNTYEVSERMEIIESINEQEYKKKSNLCNLDQFKRRNEPNQFNCVNGMIHVNNPAHPNVIYSNASTYHANYNKFINENDYNNTYEYNYTNPKEIEQNNQIYQGRTIEMNYPYHNIYDSTNRYNNNKAPRIIPNTHYLQNIQMQNNNFHRNDLNILKNPVLYLDKNKTIDGVMLPLHRGMKNPSSRNTFSNPREGFMKQVQPFDADNMKNEKCEMTYSNNNSICLTSQRGFTDRNHTFYKKNHHNRLMKVNMDTNDFCNYNNNNQYALQYPNSYENNNKQRTPTSMQIGIIDINRETKNTIIHSEDEPRHFFYDSQISTNEENTPSKKKKKKKKNRDIEEKILKKSNELYPKENARNENIINNSNELPQSKKKTIVTQRHYGRIKDDDSHFEKIYEQDQNTQGKKIRNDWETQENEEEPETSTKQWNAKKHRSSNKKKSKKKYNTNTNTYIKGSEEHGNDNVNCTKKTNKDYYKDPICKSNENYETCSNNHINSKNKSNNYAHNGSNRNNKTGTHINTKKESLRETQTKYPSQKYNKINNSNYYTSRNYINKNNNVNKSNSYLNNNTDLNNNKNANNEDNNINNDIKKDIVVKGGQFKKKKGTYTSKGQ